MPLSLGCHRGQQAVQWRRVVRVVDGDTLLLDRNERVRLIGVDTPETVDPRRPVERFGKEASDFTKRMAEGKKVRLEYDQDRRDRFGRTLAYVYLEDGTFLNAEIVKQGYGHAYTQFPFKYLKEFRGYEREAREAQRGLWKRCRTVHAASQPPQMAPSGAYPEAVFERRRREVRDGGPLFASTAKNFLHC